MRTLGCGLCLLIALAAAPVAQAQLVPPSQPTPVPRIPAGVRAVGVNIGGLTVREAAAKMNRQARRRIVRKIRVRIGRRTFALTAGRLRTRFHELSTARRALGAKPGAKVKPVIGYRRKSLVAFARRAKQVTARRPRNASMRITLRRVRTRKARYGRRISCKRLAAALKRRVLDPTLHRGLRPKVRRLRPRVRLVELRRRYPTILTVTRGGHRLRVFRRLRFSTSYPVAVGAAGFDTPTGVRYVQNIQVNPSWTAPNRPWAGSLAGHTYGPGDPNNPLRARFISLGDGIGIHGTSESFSIGQSASHGCIRMYPSDVIQVANVTHVGTPVLIR